MAVRLSKLPKRLTAFHLWIVYHLTSSSSRGSGGVNARDKNQKLINWIHRTSSPPPSRMNGEYNKKRIIIFVKVVLLFILTWYPERNRRRIRKSCWDFVGGCDGIGGLDGRNRRNICHRPILELCKPRRIC